MSRPPGALFHKADYEVRKVPLSVGQELVRRLHYARGGSNTCTDMHGLFLRTNLDRCLGVAWWLPPTRVAAESVNRDNWKRVVSLTRLVLEPEVPCNGATFLLAASVRLLKADKRWASLVTYADESQGHLGGIYRAANWDYVGRTGPYPRWLSAEGQQVAPKATKNRNKAEMLALGHVLEGRYHKHKYVLHLERHHA